eukprot:scaffold179873_cov30-Tisochrysis_lutea.AAC.2
MMSRTIMTGAAFGERAKAASLAQAACAAATSPPDEKASITLTTGTASDTLAAASDTASTAAAPAAPAAAVAAAAAMSVAASPLTPSSTPTALMTYEHRGRGCIQSTHWLAMRNLAE